MKQNKSRLCTFTSLKSLNPNAIFKTGNTGTHAHIHTHTPETRAFRACTYFLKDISVFPSYRRPILFSFFLFLLLLRCYIAGNGKFLGSPFKYHSFDETRSHFAFERAIKLTTLFIGVKIQNVLEELSNKGFYMLE